MADEAKTPDPSADELLDPVIGSWDEGIARVRNGARWILVVLGAAATFLFGAGTLGKRPELSWAENATQLLVALACAVVAIALLGFVVREVARVFTPEVVSLEDVEATKEFTDREVDYFGPRALAGVRPRTQLRFAEAAIPPIEDALGRMGPVPADGESAEDAAKRARLAAALQGAEARLAQYQAGAAALLGFARYQRVQSRRSVRPSTWWAAGAALVLGMTYQLVLSSPAADKASSASGSGGSTPSGVVALVLADETPGATEIWTAVGLDDCAPTRAFDDVDGSVALVEIIDGKGTEESPWTVRTVPETSGEDCRRVEVVLPAGVATTVEPLPTSVEVTVRPTVTWSPGGP